MFAKLSLTLLALGAVRAAADESALGSSALRGNRKLQSLCDNDLPGINGSNNFGDNVCCPLQCNQCGGTGCGSNGDRGFGNKECCPNGIVANQGDCAVTGKAPCVITDATAPPATTPAPTTPGPTEAGSTCSNGLPGIGGTNDNGEVCCPLACNQCGGQGCFKNGDGDLSNEECCVNGVLNNQDDCGGGVTAPCVIVSTPAPTTAPPDTIAPTTVAPTTVAPTTAAPIDPICGAFGGLLNENSNGDTCCPTSCGVCQWGPDAACNTRPGGQAACCPWRIRRDAGVCGENGVEAPCNVPDETPAPTTVAPTTVAPTTVAPTTVAPTTVSPTTVAPTTVAPTTASPTTVAPTTVAPTTAAPTTAAPTDPNCGAFGGVYNGNTNLGPVCCAAACGVCSFSGGDCEMLPGGATDCCPGNIRDNTAPCSATNPAPCTLFGYP